MIIGNLGEFNPKVSKIGLGLSQLTNTKNKLTYGYKSKKEILSIIKYAIKEKINFFDTAELYSVPPNAESYGKTEKMIGNWFERKKNREKIFEPKFTTKSE